MKKRWVVQKALRFCFPYILLNVSVLLLISISSVYINVINKNIINVLTKDIEWGSLSVSFIVFVIAYAGLYLLQHVGSFLRAVTGNLVRLKLDELFYKIFMYKSYRTPQEKFLSTDYMEQYSFVEGNVSKIVTS